MKNSVPTDAPGEVSMEERERFLDLLTRYKLKLQDAADKKLIEDPEVKAELQEYRSSLATTYILEKQIAEPGVRRLYDRRQEEIRGQHILVKLTPEMGPNDTLIAYNKALNIIRLLNAGADFDSLALADSEDPTARTNRGDLYFFTGGQMVAPFEDAAYAMKAGEVSQEPLRTSFGYHVLRVTARQPVRGFIKVRHIMALAKKSAADTADTVAAMAKVRAWQDSLAAGADFGDLAKAVSEDVGSAPRGGELGWFERKRYVQPFDEACFLLNPGEVSPIVRTPYGYHLIRMDSIRPPESYDDVRAAAGDPLKKQYQQIRFTNDFNAFIDSLMRKFDYSFDEANFSTLLAGLDSNMTTEDSAWDGGITEATRVLPLIKMNSRTYSVDTVLTMLLDREELQNILLRRSELESQFRKISEGLLLDAEGAGLEQRSPEFASLMTDFTDGIVLYRAEQLEVWNKTVVSDSGLRAYWDLNKSDFKFPPNVTFADMNF
jgi:peptidyl-prolyl cis-trans isomerase SurA